MSTETETCASTQCCVDKKAAKRKPEEEVSEENKEEAVKQQKSEEAAQPCTAPSAQENVLKSLEEWDDWKKDYVKEQDQQQVIVTDKPKNNFRNFLDGKRQERVTKFYSLQHRFQTYEYATSMVEKYASLNHFEMTVWEAIEYLNTIVDESDPDTDLTQLQHALQTAEACRKKWPDEKYDWIHLTGLIHDLGKILAVKNDTLKLPGEPQWAVVGDTFPVGLPFSEKNVMFGSFSENPDTNDAKYNTDCGVYKKGCGLSNVTMSWGHDEYMYRVIAGNCPDFPLPALYMLRYHSFYPWHREGAYMELTDEQDRDMLPFVKEFNECDLYSKSESVPVVEELAPYYKKLIEKYMPGKLRW